MNLVVREPFHLNGVMKNRGDVLSASEAADIVDTDLSSRCVAIADDAAPVAAAPDAPKIQPSAKAPVDSNDDEHHE